MSYCQNDDFNHGDYTIKVAVMIKTVGIMSRTSLEWQLLPEYLYMGFIVLIEFGWHIETNIRPGVGLLMITPLVSMMYCSC